MDMDIYYLEDIRWVSWTQAEAIGIGTAVTEGCVPRNSRSCTITNTLTSIPDVRFTFSHPKGICGRYYWTQMLAHYPIGAPANLRAYDHQTIFPLSTLKC
jgi:hypothetical protein